jgi:hypothetical protein
MPDPLTVKDVLVDVVRIVAVDMLVEEGLVRDGTSVDNGIRVLV